MIPVQVRAMEQAKYERLHGAYQRSWIGLGCVSTGIEERKWICKGDTLKKERSLINIKIKIKGRERESGGVESCRESSNSLRNEET